MKVYRVYQNGDDYGSLKSGNSTFVVSNSPRRTIDSTTITFSLDTDNDTFTVALSNLSSHTQYLLNNNRLGVCLVAERTCKCARKGWYDDDADKFKEGRRTARKYHPYDNICSSVYEVSSTSATTYSHTFTEYDCQKLNFIFDKSALYEEPYREDGWIRYRVMLCTLPKYSGYEPGKCNGSPCVRGYKKSNSYVEITVDNNH